jgi:hypothetical protein
MIIRLRRSIERPPTPACYDKCGRPAPPKRNGPHMPGSFTNAVCPATNSITSTAHRSADLCAKITGCQNDARANNSEDQCIFGGRRTRFVRKERLQKILHSKIPPMIPCPIDGTRMDFWAPASISGWPAAWVNLFFGKPVRPDNIRLCTRLRKAAPLASPTNFPAIATTVNQKCNPL